MKRLCAYEDQLHVPSVSEKGGKGRLATFSSPMVNLPVVTSFAAAKASSFCTGSAWETEMANLTLDLVYSCPGWSILVSDKRSSRALHAWTYIDNSIIRQRRKPLIQRLVHLGCIPLKELATS